MELRDHDYIDAVRDRVEALCTSGVWSPLQSGRCAQWLDQFAAAGHSLLGACLLDNLIYRSEDQTVALFRCALSDGRLLRDSDESDLALIERLASNTEPGVRLVPVVSPERPTKSGALMLRWLEHKLGLRRWHTVLGQLSELSEDVKELIAIDDFCGSGKQFSEKFLRSPEVQALRTRRPDLKIRYVVAAAHRGGITRIQREGMDVEIVAGEVLGDEHHFFDGPVLGRHNIPELAERLRREYDDLAARHQLGGRTVGTTGFADQALTYAFSHGTPNNTLPIYWYQADQWQPLLTR